MPRIYFLDDHSAIAAGSLVTVFVLGYYPLWSMVERANRQSGNLADDNRWPLELQKIVQCKLLTIKMSGDKIQKSTSPSFGILL